MMYTELFENICAGTPATHSVLQGISLSLKYWPHLFLPKPTPPPPKKKSKSARPPMSLSPPQNFRELGSPTWNVSSCKIAKTHFLKK